MTLDQIGDRLDQIDRELDRLADRARTRADLWKKTTGHDLERSENLPIRLPWQGGYDR